MHAVSGPAPRRVLRQTGIVIGLLDQVLRPSPLVVKPHRQINGPVHIGHEPAIDIFRGVEELILLALLGVILLLPVAQSDEAGKRDSNLRADTGIRTAGRRRSCARASSQGSQSVQQTRGLARHQDEAHLGFFVGLHRLPTIETGIGPCEDGLNALGQGLEDTLQMARDLLAVGLIAIAQFSPMYSRVSAIKVRMG
jgi:hypothetical protein